MCSSRIQLNDDIVKCRIPSEDEHLWHVSGPHSWEDDCENIVQPTPDFPPAA